MRRLFTLKYLFIIIIVVLGNAKVSGQVNHVVISQIYGGGGNSGAPYQNDFIELFNPTATAVSLAGWSVQYASATGTAWSSTTLLGSIGAGKYYLIKLASNALVGLVLPPADATGTTNMAGAAGKVLLSNALTVNTTACPNSSTIDFVGYGTTVNCFEGSGFAPAPSNTTADLRKLCY